MDVKIVSTTESLLALQPEWERLEKQEPDATFYSTFTYIQAWWNSFVHNPHVSLHIACVYQNNKLSGIAPLAIFTEKKKDKKRKVLRFAVPGDFHTVLVDREHNPQTVLKYLFRHLDNNPAWEAIVLKNIPGTSTLTAYLLRSQDNKDFVYHIENPYIDLQKYQDFADFKNKSLPSTVINLRNKLQREVGFTFQVFHGNEDNIFEQISELHRLEKEYLQKLGRSERHSLFDDPYRTQHVKNVFTNTDNAITFAYQDPEGKLIGYRTCYLHNKMLLSWNSAYHPDFVQYRIGKILQYDLLDYVFKNKLAHTFDWGAGRYSWKFEWTNTFTTSYKLQKKIKSTKNSEEKPAQPSPETKPLIKPKQNKKKTKTKAKKSFLAKIKKRLAKAKQKIWGQFKPSTPAIWYIPHPDDETLYMGGSIYEHRERENIVVLLTRGGASKARKTINKKLKQPLTVKQFMKARKKEFTKAMKALGIAKQNIIDLNLPDGELSVSKVYEIMVEMENKYPHAAHKTMSCHDPHRDHRAAGAALQQAYDEGKIKDASFYLPPVIQAEHDGLYVDFSKSGTVAAKQKALRQYMVYKPKQGRYAVGNNSVATLIAEQYSKPVEKFHLPTKGK